MREAAGPANAMDLAAARSIAQLVCRVDIGSNNPRLQPSGSPDSVKSPLTPGRMPSF
jgi:hypothetical protein